MLNPPLSHLSDDVLGYIVEHVANLPFPNQNLSNLSLADRVFTQSCQSRIFRTLSLGHDRDSGAKKEIFKKLGKLAAILDRKPSFADRVRVIQLSISHEQNAWILNDPTFLSILQLLAKSPIPPHELHFGGPVCFSFTIEDPILLVERLIQSFFSQTLTTLHLNDCDNIPLSLFLICPGLKEVRLDCVGQLEETLESYDTCPDNQCSDRKAPTLESFGYCDSQRLVKRMIAPPSTFRMPVIIWSRLRVLRLSPHEDEEMACLQPILKEACSSLEELYLTNSYLGVFEQIPLAGVVNLRGLSRLRTFALYAIITCGAKEPQVLQDINTVLDTIPISNQIANLSFSFEIQGSHPYDGCLDQDWVGLYNEAIRISDGKPLELELHAAVNPGASEPFDFGAADLFACIEEKAGCLTDHPNICPHFWDPPYRARGIVPFPRDQVRGRCKR